MKVVPTEIPDVLLIEPRVFPDARGEFFEAWRDERYREALGGAAFVQDSVSVTRRGVVRGLHFQQPFAQGKLVTVLSGAVLDIAVDVRRGSPTFGRWVAEELSAANHKQLWIPAGFAHGFQALADGTVFSYKMTETYHPESERVVNYADPAIGISWPLPVTTVAPKDAAAPMLSGLPPEFLPVYP